MRRTDLDEMLPVEMEKQLKAGEYAKYRGMFILRAPNGDLASIGPNCSTHTIIEHGDGSLTVTPSIQFETGSRWHGYLKAGVWQQA